MVRSIIFAIGLFLLILGGQSLVVDKLVLSNRVRLPRLDARQAAGNPYGQTQTPFANGSSGVAGNPYSVPNFRVGQDQYYSQASAVRNAPALNGPKRVYQTRDWMPWSLLAAGAVVVMYSASMKQG